MGDLADLSTDRLRAVELTREGLAARGPASEEALPFHSMLEREVADGAARGGLWREGDRAIGIALWDASSPLGLHVQLLYLARGASTGATYAEFVRAVATRAGPIAALPGNLDGLSAVEEASTLEGLGFARFARSEMRFPPAAPVPVLPPMPDGGTIRPARDADRAALTELHARAYSGRFDRFLFLADWDERKDSAAAISEILDGRYGAFVPWASPIVERAGRASAAAIVVRASYGPLIADVMVDPTEQGRGLGRAILAWTVRALRERGDTTIVLNVTEGNARAVRLYEGMGFVRSLGPSHAWYSTERIPVSPASP